MNRIVLFAMSLAAFSVTTGSFAQDVTIRLTPSPAVVLRGLPVAFLVTYTNNSADTLTFVDGLRLHVAGDRSFIATFAGNDTFGLPPTQTTPCDGTPCFTLAAGASRTFYIDFGPTLDMNPFFMDSRLSTPGAYILQIEGFLDRQVFGLQSVLSAEVPFQVLQPVGGDATFWQYMQNVGDPAWSCMDWTHAGGTVAAHAYSGGVVSSYVPWVAGLLRGATDQKVAAYDLALSTDIPTALRDTLLMGKATALRAASVDALWIDSNVDVALSRADAERAVLAQLIKVTAVDVTRQNATEMLDAAYTPTSASAILKDLIAHAPPAPLAVQPKVDCVQPGVGKAFSAVFSYSNPNKAGKTLLISDANQVTPAPRDQGQPRYLVPGTHLGAFTGQSPGGELIWHLDGLKAVATVDYAVKCTPPTP
jgi:hypothetical protein